MGSSSGSTLTAISFTAEGISSASDKSIRYGDSQGLGGLSLISQVKRLTVSAGATPGPVPSHSTTTAVVFTDIPLLMNTAVQRSSLSASGNEI